MTDILIGGIGLLQTLVLPGWIVLKAGKFRGGWLEKLILLLPFSLIANYLGVFLLSLLKCYSAAALWIAIALETLALIWLYRRSLRTPLTSVLLCAVSGLRQEFAPLHEMLRKPAEARAILSHLVWLVSGCGALSALLWSLHVCRLRIGTVFSGWDTLFSWNAYAETWASGSIPLVHGLYPQLLPANWSISYVLLGSTELQLFNTLIPPLFFLMIFLIFFDLGFQQKQSAFFIAAVIARYMMKKLMGDQIFDGYMDVPCAALSLLVVYTFLKAKGRCAADQRRALFSGVIFACGAAITKQVGFCVLILTPFLIFWWLREPYRQQSAKTRLLLVLPLLLIVLPWYAHCLLNSGSASSEGSELIAKGIVQFNTQYEWSHKIFLARQQLGIYGIFFIFSLAGLPWIPKRYRLPFFLLSWPLTLIWVAFYTYDLRNLAAALPFISATCGFAVLGIMRSLFILCGRLRCGRLPFFILLILAGLAAALCLMHFLPDEKLAETQRQAQRQLFGSQLNQELLYDRLGEEHSGNDILTDYPANFLSGYRDCCSMIDFSDAAHFEELLRAPQIHYLLSPMLIQNEVSWDAALVLEDCIRQGRCTELACSRGYYIPYCLYEVK